MAPRRGRLLSMSHTRARLSSRRGRVLPGPERLEGQADQHVPAAGLVGRHVPVGNDGRGLVDALEAALALADGLDRKHQRPPGRDQLRPTVRSSHSSVSAIPAVWARSSRASSMPSLVAMGIGIIAVVGVSGHGGEVDLDGEMQARLAGQVIELVMDLELRRAGGQLDRLLDPDRVPIGMARAAP